MTEEDILKIIQREAEQVRADRSHVDALAKSHCEGMSQWSARRWLIARSVGLSVVACLLFAIGVAVWPGSSLSQPEEPSLAALHRQPSAPVLPPTTPSRPAALSADDKPQPASCNPLHDTTSPESPAPVDQSLLAPQPAPVSDVAAPIDGSTPSAGFSNILCCNLCEEDLVIEYINCNLSACM